RMEELLTPDLDTLDSLRYVAFAPYVAESMSGLPTLTWTIVPVKLAPKDTTAESPLSSIRLPASSAGLHSFTKSLRYVSTGKTLKKDTPCDILIIDAVAIALET